MRAVRIYFKRCIAASFTVEAALIMTVTLPVLLSVLYYGFFLHDKGVLNGAAQQIAAQADLNRKSSLQERRQTGRFCTLRI